MSLLEKMAGARLLALINYCRGVDAGIAGRKLAQLKLAAEAFREMPKDYPAGRGGTTFYGSVTVVFYALLLSYVCLALTVKTAIGGLGFIVGVAVFLILGLALIGIEKGRTLSLKLFLAVWLLLCVCNVPVAGWFLIAPFSAMSLAFWVSGIVLLWLVRKVMNGPELTKLMQWRVSLKIAQFRRQALTQSKRK